MGKTIGYHVVKSAYGLWLPGDERGSWSEAWDDELGYVEPHQLHECDPVRKRMAEERMKQPALCFTDEMIDVISHAIEKCVERSCGGLSVVASAIEQSHIHLLIPYSGRDIHKTAKWFADQTTKAIHKQTDHSGKVWAKGKWCSFVYDESYWNNIKAYIEGHSRR